MLLIAAAMEEEVQVALSLCRDLTRVQSQGVSLRQGTRSGRKITFLKAGVGPRKAAASLERALEGIQVSHILVIGYAGALDPELKLGSLVAVGKALLCTLGEDRQSLEHMRLDSAFELANGEAMVRAATTAGLDACMGDTLTTAHVLGNPEHKRLLFDKFHALIVDMETAALARVAQSRSIPISCIRVVSDEAQDTFLAPFSYDPSVNIPARAARIICKGNPVKVYREWRDHASVARTSLGRLLAHYL